MKAALIAILFLVLLCYCDKPIIKTYIGDTNYIEQSIGYHADTIYNLKVNLPEGTYLVYYDKLFINKCMEASISNGNIFGKVTRWYRNGNKSHEYFIKNHNKDSTETEWFENGKIKFLKLYKDSLLNKCTFWNESGNLKSESFYFGGVEILKILFENNKITSYEIYKPNNPKFGVPVKIIDFWENGNIKLEKSEKKEYLTDKETGQIIERAIKNEDQWYDKEGNRIDEKRFKELIEKIK
jgi:antitoxin component YwqK of YwqJK toxin-antitoxin module